MVPVPLADNATVPVPHLAPFVTEGDEGTAFTVAVTAFLVAPVQAVSTIESIA